jgi:hypothetical protein
MKAQESAADSFADIGMFQTGQSALLDLDRLVGSHLCIQANSGGGKSGAIRKILETSHGRIQHVIIDVEDEFYTLREKFEYLIAGGDNGDCVANVNNSADLATMILKTGYSAIIQINSLPIDQRRLFIEHFLTALIAAPKTLWRPLLVVLDEAQSYCPKVGKVESSEAVVSLMTLGRKRGFTGVLATPRLAMLHNDATGPVNNWLMGRIGQPADRRTTADALGFSAKSPEAMGLLKMETRNFWAFGPALCLEPTRLRIGDAATTVIKAGQAAVPTPPAPAAMQRILAQLNEAAKATKELDPETADVPALRAEIVRLTALTKQPQNIPQNIPDAGTIAAAKQRGAEAALRDASAKMASSISGYQMAVQHLFRQLETDIVARIANIRIDVLGSFAEPAQSPKPPAASPSAPPSEAAQTGDGSVTPTLQKALNAIAWWHKIGRDPVEKARACVVAGLSPKASTFGVYLAELAKRGMVWTPEAGKVSLTDAGRKQAIWPTASTAADLYEMAASLLGPQEQKAFDVVYRAYPRAISRKSVAEAMELSPTASTTGVYLAAVAGYGIIENAGRGEVRAAEWLFI